MTFEPFSLLNLTLKPLHIKCEAVFCSCAPTEIRTLVLALKGLRPGPLDDGGKRRNSTTA